MRFHHLTFPAEERRGESHRRLRTAKRLTKRVGFEPRRLRSRESRGSSHLGGIHALPVNGILAYGVEGAARGSGFGEFYNPCFFNRAIVSRNMR